MKISERLDRFIRRKFRLTVDWDIQFKQTRYRAKPCYRRDREFLRGKSYYDGKYVYMEERMKLINGRMNEINKRKNELEEMEVGVKE